MSASGAALSSTKKRKSIDNEYEDESYFDQKEKAEEQLAEQRKRRRERLAQVALENQAVKAGPTPSTERNDTETGTREVPAITPSEQSTESHQMAQPEQSEAELDDMFDLENPSFLESKQSTVTKDPVTSVEEASVYHMNSSAIGLHDNWDDPDGYYRVMLGEKLQSRYQIFSILGRGIFATVVRAKDLAQNGREVAIKIARRQETMYKAGMKEIHILRLLSDADPDNKMFIVHFYAHFEHRGHLCMVFESLGLNLREIVKRFGKDVGLNLHAVKTYTKQMLLALALLKAENIVHADIKPDNVLVNDAKTIAKLADFGSAASTTSMDITPYLVSRFYRAPEISTCLQNSKGIYFMRLFIFYRIHVSTHTCGSFGTASRMRGGHVVNGLYDL